jgi:hypothetical protein
MKKLVLILSAVVVMIAFAVPSFADMYDPDQRMAKLAEEEAAVLKASGELTFGTVTPFDAPNGAIGFYNFYVDFTMWPDEYNSVLIELAGDGAMGNWGDKALISSGPNARIPYFELTTDVGSFLDLPVGLKNTAGRTSLYTNKYEVTGHAYERNKVRTWIDPLAWKFAVDADVVQVTAALGFGEGAEALNDIGVYAFVPAVADMADIEIWYLAQDNADYKGKFGASAKVTDIADMIGVAGGFVFDTVEGAVPEWAFGIGASAAYMDYTLGVSLNGDDVDTLDQFGIDADAKFGDFGANAALGMSFADGADTFQGAEIAAYIVIGNAQWTAGYTIADGTGYAYNPAVAGPDGGLFVNADIDF